jgi:hypothetical protein
MTISRRDNMDETIWSAVSVDLRSQAVNAEILAAVGTSLGLRPSRMVDRGSLASPRNPRSVRLEESIVVYDANLSKAANITEKLGEACRILELLSGVPRETWPDGTSIELLIATSHGTRELQINTDLIRLLHNCSASVQVNL